MKHLLLITLTAVSLLAADATGRWTGTLTVTSDRQEIPGPALLVLKQEGAKLTGTAGPRASELQPIQNGKAVGGNLTFDLPSGDFMMRFTLKRVGDEIKGDITRERRGEKQTAKLAVKRDKAAK